MGEVFAGRYEFLEPIGHGGMGTVWLVWDARDRVHRAAKLLLQADAGSLIRFVREQALRIDHQHCVTPRGWSAEDDRVLFTMDLVRGGSVHDLVRDYGALPAPWVATLLDQLLLALEAVHGAGIVHRDVKPANLLLEATGRGRPHLRLGDFGVAVALSEPRLTQAATVLGTPGYRAPEQLAGSDPHPAQDLWAAGAVLVELLTGRRPPNEPGELAATAPAGVDERLWRLAHWLARSSPGDRPGAAAEARDVLARSGLVAPDGVAPDGADSDIEVFEHVAVPADPGDAMARRGPSDAGRPPDWVAAGGESRRPEPAPPPSETLREAEAAVGHERSSRSGVRALGWLAILAGVVLVVVAVLAVAQ